MQSSRSLDGVEVTFEGGHVMADAELIAPATLAQQADRASGSGTSSPWPEAVAPFWGLDQGAVGQVASGNPVRHRGHTCPGRSAMGAGRSAGRGASGAAAASWHVTNVGNDAAAAEALTASATSARRTATSSHPGPRVGGGVKKSAMSRGGSCWGGPGVWDSGGGTTSVAGRTVALVHLDTMERIGPGLAESEPTFDELALGYLAPPPSAPHRGASMKCLLWRQHRDQLLWTAVVLVIAGAVMAAVGHSADRWLTDYAHWVAQLRAEGCPLPVEGNSVVHAPPAACHALLARYSGGQQSSFAHAYNFAIPVFEEGLPVLMVVLGALIGAPLVAREVEQRTQLVAWTQSISRRRWYSTKTAILATCLALAGLLAGLANDRTQIPLNQGGLTSSRWIWFFSIDLAPAAEAVLAFALAVAIGAYLRRTLPAIGACPRQLPRPVPTHRVGRARSRPGLKSDWAPRNPQQRLGHRRRALPPGQPVLAPPVHLPRHRARHRRRTAHHRLARHPTPSGCLNPIRHRLDRRLQATSTRLLAPASNPASSYPQSPH